VVGWFAAIVILKAGSGRADFQGGSLLRVLMPAYPAFVLMLASLPFLVPGLARRTAPPALPQRFLPAHARTTALVAAAIATAVVPVAVYAAASPLRATSTPAAAVLQAPPIP